MFNSTAMFQTKYILGYLNAARTQFFFFFFFFLFFFKYLLDKHHVLLTLLSLDMLDIILCRALILIGSSLMCSVIFSFTVTREMNGREKGEEGSKSA